MTKMLITSAVLAFALTGVAGLPSAATASSAPAVMTQQVDSRVLAGSWTGQFARTAWTFEFKNENGVWSGRYMTAAANNWHDLQAVRVDGRSVSFNIESNPTLSFSLTADEQGRRLAGVAKIPNGMSVPFTADRRS
ncbi:hypothetical protein E4M02_08770 [Brevundimonas sp. S30B]|uniref:hypothetical protein n=1 Tax=unclassified Brevundimonas TaxID=2622653 RepID=UPI001072E1B6|nr:MULTISPECIES: hypothetical protein [unclassified Brevundimonas]QBX38448.1 hypothetical protein E4M01_12205 [Brevundimonas sp. MF30-B]TFW02157.1 hypothetical protein E4M02_08770 [Brevundimonas sp. S30B]